MDSSDPAQAKQLVYLKPPNLQAAISAALRNEEAGLRDLVVFEDLMGGKAGVLGLLAEQANQEQGWYWGRFSAFATLHAGLLVLVTSNVTEGHVPTFTAAGVALGVLWLFVQLQSLNYVRKTKRIYNQYQVLSGLRHASTLPGTAGQEVRRSLSASTGIGFITSLLVLGLWIVALVAALLKLRAQAAP